jgi:hypothetical protein
MTRYSANSSDRALPRCAIPVRSGTFSALAPHSLQRRRHTTSPIVTGQPPREDAWNNDEQLLERAPDAPANAGGLNRA